ncbi:MAG TPA: tRNA (adenosine(37)-N6)-threonylcarbamoyltransferase complex ATPase subunit type 1 TsaE [Candidatus Saccharimonadales bacterium]|nr:tRNA (adenosine(37)-N6)-threonylcarbamoyltransferase complex ATPase subunit type 1 TsaE [Candidatus Saccharimonadales bacterium]
MAEKLIINSSSAAETIMIGQKIGEKLRGGELIELISDLGGGKTTLTKGLAEGIGSKDKVHSPSFTIENEYISGPLTIHHLDFYRLDDPGIMKQELLEIIEDRLAVVVIEWANIVEDLLPDKRLIVRLVVDDQNSRQIIIDFPTNLKYLVEGLV